jgi:digeranylgeranylglycerophospholipid reductase
MIIKDNYDIIIVGGGPAGCQAAYTAAKKNVSVLLLEKDREIGSPVRCAEAVGKDGLEKILDEGIDPRWIVATINKFQFVAPDHTVIYPQVSMTGYVLLRKLFDYDLAMRAANAGAQILTKIYVNGLYKEEGRIAGVLCRIGNEQRTIRSRIVIGADGVESRVARWAGINTTVSLADMETCCQMTLANLRIADDTCIFYFSQEKFPGGYGWLFPKGNGTANVGLGVSGSKARHGSPCSRLQKFVEENFPDAFLLVGDAALQANPVSGGGIATGMTAGKIAGSVAADAIKANDLSGNFLNKYEKDWDKVCGNAQNRYYRLKEGISKLSDEQLNRTAQALKNIPRKKQTLVKIFQTALIKQPALLVDIVKTLSPFS